MTIDTSYASREIARQPAAWARAEQQLAVVGGLLPQRGERVAVIGCGTSWFMAEAYAALREASGAGETDAFAASQWPTARSYDRVVAITRSGTTTEVLQAIGRTSSPVTAITAVRDVPVVEVAGSTIVLDFADERSVVQTLFATTTLMLLRASLGESVEPVVAQAAAVLEGSNGLDPAVDTASQFSFVGQGWAAGIASEAALKMREAARVWTESYPQMEYRHGPISIAEPGRVVWVFGEPVPGLLDDIAATGASVVHDDLDPVADLVRVQLLSVRLAEQQGLDPDRPRNLTRSVVLSEAELTR
jgi:fructoselysine-6-P-deglycase FrlB-like protein